MIKKLTEIKQIPNPNNDTWTEIQVIQKEDKYFWVSIVYELPYLLINRMELEIPKDKIEETMKNFENEEIARVKY